MPQEKIITLYQYHELPTEKAKEKARYWFLENWPNYEWWDSIYDDAKRIGLKITNFDIGRRSSISGNIITSCPEMAETIMREHGPNCDTYKTAKDYRAKLLALGEKPDDDGPEYDFYIEQKEELDESFKHSILEDYLSILRREDEYMQSEEYIAERMAANEYTFLENGRRFG